MGQGLEAKTGAARRKVRGGKLLQVRVEHDGMVVTGAQITGDFFVHPEEGLDHLEEELVGVPVDEDVRELTMRLDLVVSRRGLVLIGFNTSDLATAVREAMG